MKRLAISLARTAGHAAMWPLEQLLLRSQGDTPPPVFIIGAPRSGTSLLYELMITRYHFSYMSNASHRFFRTPLAASKVFAGKIGAWRGNFTSRYGHIEGWGAPNEGGWIWLRWLPDGDWTDGTGFPDSSVRALRALTQGFARQVGAPFLNKNVMHSNRLRLMRRIWPNAVYIEVTRDVLDNARSIVRAERSEGGPEKHGDQWWSVRPKLAAQYAGRADTERAVAQVIGTANDIEEDIAEIGGAHLLRIDYSQMCAEPNRTLDEIARFLDQAGCPLVERFSVPDSFPVRPSKPLSDEDEASMAKVLKELSSP